MNYFLFEDDKHKVNMVFEERELETFVCYWKEGYGIERISEEMKRKPVEIALLILDRAEIGKIKPRKKGIFG
ncbi:helix-turn-helix domain containing protein [Psychrobacillus sp. FSL K6-1415]|uniref:helix-turn-helix domain containing protein n=1 Tax=Psychrobacillus sp. FSL K6-1415 TaxID=2921544 RepID=UPI0030F75401